MLYCYGENSFTYLLFHGLQRSGKVIDSMIASLKSFSDQKPFSDKNESDLKSLNRADDLDIWLFPNFGKTYGWGEPDAIVLSGGYSFWFEVETNFDLKKKLSSARHSLIQLLRFNHFAQALNQGPKIEKDKHRKVLTGLTVSSSGEVKRAVLRLKGHQMLADNAGRAYDKLTKSVEKGRDHYVILSEKQMVLETPKQILKTEFQALVDKHDGLFENESSLDQVCKPETPMIDRFWYQYYQHDLSRKFNFDNEYKDQEVKYIRISSG